MKSALLVLSVLSLLSVVSPGATTSYESVPLGGTSGPTGAWRGDNGAADLIIDGARYYNNNQDFGFGAPYWSGFAFSSHTDTTDGSFNNDLSALPGIGAGGSAVYAIGYYSPFDPISTRIDLASPAEFAGLGMSVANTTYTAFNFSVDDTFSDPFTNGDYMRLVVTGFNGLTTTGSTTVYLADFRSGNTYVLSDWTFVDLSALGTADRLEFVIETTDDGKPTYFAMDNFLAVPEPSTVMISCLGLALLARRKR